MKEKRQLLDDLNTLWKDTCTCALRSTATGPVFGHGSADAEVVFIGEAPGEKEDREGVPFIGRAGTYLTELLGSIKYDRSHVYITNSVKYRPPKNRDPLPEEKEACREWLYGELNIIAPKLIVLLGRHALWNFFPGMSIGEAHGKVLTADIPGITTTHFLPLYHPASAIYNRKLREVIAEDISRIPNILVGVKTSGRK